MSIVSYNADNETDLLNCVDRFFKNHRIGRLLAKCGGSKEKGVPAVAILKYKLGNIFIGRRIIHTGKNRVRKEQCKP